MSIRFEKVIKRFGPKTVLDEVSFEIRTGEIFFIIGKSGMGKSVTLKQIVGLMKPDGGQIFVDGLDVTKMTSNDLPLIRSKCGMVFQHPALLDSLSIYNNIAFGLNKLLSETETHKIVLDKLRLVHLCDDIINKFPAEISFGMQKRVSIARALAPSPDYLLFDEPTTSLDPITTNAITDLIAELSAARGVTSVVVSHDMGSALRIADRILMLDRGKILALATPSEIRRLEIGVVKEFLAEATL